MINDRKTLIEPMHVKRYHIKMRIVRRHHDKLMYYPSCYQRMDLSTCMVLYIIGTILLLSHSSTASCTKPNEICRNCCLLMLMAYLRYFAKYDRGVTTPNYGWSAAVRSSVKFAVRELHVWLKIELEYFCYSVHINW